MTSGRFFLVIEQQLRGLNRVYRTRTAIDYFAVRMSASGHKRKSKLTHDREAQKRHPSDLRDVVVEPQNDPTALPSPITAASANSPPTIDTMTMSR